MSHEPKFEILMAVLVAIFAGGFTLAIPKKYRIVGVLIMVFSLTGLAFMFLKKELAGIVSRGFILYFNQRGRNGGNNAGGGGGGAGARAEMVEPSTTTTITKYHRWKNRPFMNHRTAR